MSIQANFPAIKPTLLLDFANTEALDPRITFTRASTGTYYDGKTVAKAEENLLLQSQAFDNASWVNSGTITTTANTTAAPDGTITADRLQIAAGNTFKYQNISLISGATYVISVYVMSNTGSNQTFRLFGNDLSSSSADQTATTSWQRFTFTYTASSASSVAVGIRTDIANTAADILVWGAQLEQRASVTAYTPTTTAPITNYIPVLLTAAAGVPRFDHNPITGESLGLLIEEQRTNLVTYSSDFDNPAWNKFQSATITANATTAPDGTSTADLLTWGTGNASGIYQVASSAFVSSMSVYAKTYSGSPVLLVGDDSGSRFAHFNLATGALVANSGTSSTSITPVGNGWYRLVVVFATSPSNIKFISGTGVAGSAYIWGAQLEAGAFPTSYIPTVASQVTRAADSAVMTGANFSSWYRQGQGTLYSEATAIAPGAVTGFGSVEISNGNFDRRMFHGVSGNVYRAYYQLPITSMNTNATAIAGVFAKLATGYDASGVSMSAAGGTVVTGSAWTDSSAANTLRIGATFGSVGNNYVRKITYYPQRLSNAQLQALTS